MRNRAKCKLCGSVVESFLREDYVICKCGEIYVDGGQFAYLCGARDWGNFLRVDDEGVEIVPKIEDKTMQKATNQVNTEISRDTLIEELGMLIDAIEGLPPMGRQTYVTQADLGAVLTVIKEILRRG